ncbi:hypothetical protein HCN44_007661 [Aphidius gifuensis]|uniref:Replication protein A 70 kDa DNA-binding subunit n=1 Tax=Aphidius gifuensis TaxID=684658 RepID=A0A834XJY7_APHGI|nr:replication protein A 70 kDa DNA-binding subunit-like [Aphidius gifuensis]KAF7988167.1 hypothetical protein HCN44_007661 [Aphidius gifuensis]
MISLRRGSIERILRGEQVANTTVQVLDIVKIPSTDGDSYHYRLEISDGEFKYSFAALSQSLNHLVKDNIIDLLAIVKLDEYFMLRRNINQGRPDNVIIIFSLNVLVKGDRVQYIIGQPKKYVCSFISAYDQLNSLIPPKKNIGVEKEACSPPKIPRIEEKKLNSSKADSSSAKIKPDNEKSLIFMAGKTLKPICDLDDSSRNWVIKAKVVSKFPVMIWTKANGSSGPMFSFNLFDESGAIRVRAYNNEVNQFNDVFQEGQYYFVADAQVMKITDRKNNTTNHLYDMKLMPHTKVTLCNVEEEVEEVSTIIKKYKYMPLENINELVGVKINDYVDVLCVIKNIDKVQEVTKKTGSLFNKRNVILIDQSRAEITLTLWGQHAVEFKANNGDIIEIKNSKVGEYYYSRTLSGKRNLMTLNPDIPEAKSLRKWYEIYSWCSLTEGINKSLQSIYKMPEPFISKVEIKFIDKENIINKTCPSKDCLEKVFQKNGKYTCFMCKTNWDNYEPRLSAKLTVCDWSSVIYTVAPNDVVEKIIGLSAVEVDQLQRDDKNKIIKKLADVSYQPYQLKMRIKYEQNSYPQLDVTVVDANPVNYKTYNTYLLERIKNHMRNK